MKTSLYLTNLLFQDVNAINNSYTIGFPALTNFVGLAKAIELKFLKIFPAYNEAFAFDSIMIIVNDLFLSKSHAKYG